MTDDHPLTQFAKRLQDWMAEPLPGPPNADAQTEFAARARELFALQFDYNPPYRALCLAQHQTPMSVRSWWEIPVMPATAFKACDLTCLPPEDRIAVFHSSGTTSDTVSRHYHQADSLAVYAAAIEAGFAAQIRRPGPAPFPDRLRFLSLVPNFTLAPQSSLAFMFDQVLRQFGDPESLSVGRVQTDELWTLDFTQALAALGAAVEAGQPVFILGTAWGYVELLETLAERGARLTLPHGTWVLETGGYKGRSRALPAAELYARIQRGLGVPSARVMSEYGMCELSSQAYARTAANGSRVFCFPHWARVRVVSPETGGEVAEGETGLIQVFDLANVYSVLGVQTEDLGVRRGSGFEWQGRAALSESRGCSQMAPG